MQLTAYLILFASFCLVNTGCQLVSAKSKPPKQPPFAGTNDAAGGYALLFSLSGDESDLSKLKWIKHEGGEVKMLMDAIAATNRAVHKKLAGWQDIDTRDDKLPAAEKAARKAISHFKTSKLLHSKGNELEVELLLSQNEALTYGAHLALVLSTSDVDRQRAAYFAEVYRDVLTLQRKVQALLGRHYKTDPAPR
jgi:hypothetical protein